VDAGRAHYYLDGVHHGAARLMQALALNRERPWQIGGWDHGHAQCAFDEIRVYDRPLSEREMFGPKAVSRLVDGLELEALYHSQERRLESRLWSWDGTRGEAEFALVPGNAGDGESDPDESRRWVAGLAETHPGSGRYLARTSVDVADLPPGQYGLIASVRGAETRAVARVEIGDPAWLNDPLGREPRVMAPWTPVRAHASGGETDGPAVTVEIWGRAYRFGPAGIIERVDSRGRALTAGPVRAVMAAGGRPVTWRGGGARITESHDTHACVEQRFARDDGIALVARHRIEFDGLARTQLECRADTPTRIDALELEGQWMPDAAKLYFLWPPGDRHSADAGGKGLTGEVAVNFKPIVFLAARDVGFA
jgi:hypothetical protein